MAHPEYVSLFAREGDRAVAALGEEGDSAVLLPLVLRPLAVESWAAAGEEAWDATTPYGYGGPFTVGERPPDAAAFWGAYGDFCREARIATTFARLSLFEDGLALGPALPGRVAERCRNVVVPLAGGVAGVRQAYDRDVRRRLRVAERQGLTVEVDRDGARLDAFCDIYAHTMERRGAAPWYRFRRPFFERLLAALQGQLAFVHALAQGRVVSSELALASSHHVYAFLGGTDAAAFRVYPNEAVRDATAAWAAGEGKAAYVLGGGKDGEDGVLRHKLLFAPREGVVAFRTACLVHDEVTALRLARRRAEAEAAAGSGWAPRPEFFPVYRA
jgi:CelD/BcsL family acetyltransferase involved in cellulose biosynthesis